MVRNTGVDFVVCTNYHILNRQNTYVYAVMRLPIETWVDKCEPYPHGYFGISSARPKQDLSRSCSLSKYWNATQMHKSIGYCFKGPKPETHQVNKAAEKDLQTASLEGESS